MKTDRQTDRQERKRESKLCNKQSLKMLLHPVFYLPCSLWDSNRGPLEQQAGAKTTMLLSTAVR